MQRESESLLRCLSPHQNIGPRGLEKLLEMEQLLWHTLGLSSWIYGIEVCSVVYNTLPFTFVDLSSNPTSELEPACGLGVQPLSDCVGPPPSPI